MTTTDSESIDSVLREVARAPAIEPARCVPGDRIGPYEVRTFLGAGGMGEVYRGWDPRLARDVAIKIMTSSDRIDDERARRFEQEARAVGALDHPNIVAIYDVGTHEARPYLILALLEGMTLRERLATPLPAREAVEFALQIARGLIAAHEHGIVHRDLKPENLFVTVEGRVKILDFGLAKATAQPGSGDVTDEGTVLGTAPYMSPEQVRGQLADPRSDIFAFGAILYEILTGKRAFDGETGADTISAVLTRDPPRLPRSLPVALERVVRRCLEKRAGDRFQAAREVALALEHVSWRSASTRRRVAGGLVISGVLAAGAWGLTREDRDPAAPQAFVTFPDGRVARMLTIGGEGMSMVQQTVRAPDGTLFVAGHMTSPFSIGGTAIAAQGTARKGFVLALSADGQTRWHRTLLGTSDSQVVALAADGRGTVTAVGIFGGPIELGNGVALPAPGQLGVRDCFIAAFGASDGVPRWARACGASQFGHARAVVADREGNVYVTGEYTGAARFGGTIEHHPSGEGFGIFVASYRSDGAVRWVMAGSTATKWARSFGLAEHAGEVWFAGQVSGPYELGGVDLVADEAGDALLGVLDAATGVPRRIRTLAGPGAQSASSVAFGPGGELVVGGAFSGTTEIVPGAPVTSAGDRDGFVALLDREGRAVRAWTGGGTGRDGVTAVRFGPRGIVATGSFENRFRIGGHELDTRGSLDGYVVEIDPAGPVRSLLGFGGTGQDRPRSLDVDPDGTIRLTGKHRFDAEFAGRPMHARGLIDGFVLELRPAK